MVGLPPPSWPIVGRSTNDKLGERHARLAKEGQSGVQITQGTGANQQGGPLTHGGQNRGYLNPLSGGAAGYNKTEDRETKVTQPWYTYYKYLDDVARNYEADTRVSTASGTTALTLPSVGIIHAVAPATTVAHFIGPPQIGRRLTIVGAGTVATLRVRTTSTGLVFRSATGTPTTGWFLNFFTTAVGGSTVFSIRSVDLIGITSSAYQILNNPGGITVTTT